MKNKYIKIGLLIYILISTILLGSCEVTNEYTIKYYVDNEEVLLKPDHYRAGDYINLPILEDKGNLSFDGWYLSNDFQGDKITHLDESVTGNQSLYAHYVNNDFTNYEITFIIDGNKVVFKDFSFSNGEPTTLPIPRTPEDCYFDGWYYNDKKVQNTSELVLTDNIELHGFIKKATNDELNKAFNYTNYSYTVNYTYYNYEYCEKYFIDNSNFKYQLDDFYVSLVLKGSLTYCYFNIDNVDYYVTENDTNVYDTYSYYVTPFILKDIDLSKIIKLSNYYTVSDDYLDEFGSLVTGYLDDYHSVKIYIENDLISKIILSSTDTYGEELNYEVIFTDYKNTLVSETVNALYYESTNKEIKDLYNMNKGEEVTISGIVTATYGNNFYLDDGTKGILVYLGNSSEHNMFIEVGNSLTVTGSIDIYKNIHQIKDISSIGYANKEYLQSEVINQTSLKESILKDNIGYMLNFNNLTIRNLPSNYPVSGSDVSFEITDGANIVTVFISKHINSTSKQQLFNDISNLNINDIISLKNVYISYYTNYQIALNEQSIIALSTSSDEPNIVPTTRFESDKAPILEILDNFAYDSETNQTYGVTRGLPSIGNPKVLVIPIGFKNEAIPKNVVDNLEKAFFGTSADTGWESLSSYYYKSSYGKVSITGTVLDVYQTGNTTSYYDNLYKKYLDKLDEYNNYETDEYPDSVEWSIIKEALEYYDNKIDYSEYDTDDDGYIDSIYLIYLNEYNTDDDSLWWAFSDEYLTDEIEYYDNTEVDFYGFMSYYFLEDEFYGKNVAFNTETIIHETGHLFGLDDYYDYDEEEGPLGGFGGGDMMDANVGDHNAYSKAILGWINPYVVCGSDSKITLTPFEVSGDAIFIFKDYKKSLFDEYIVIDFYTPTHLNKDQAGHYGLLTDLGIRIYHVNATLNKPEDAWSVFEITKYNNSYSNKKLISIIEADNNNSILNNEYSKNSDLFKQNDILSNYRWHDGTSINFKIIINSINNNEATITIDYK